MADLSGLHVVEINPPVGSADGKSATAGGKDDARVREAVLRLDLGQQATSVRVPEVDERVRAELLADVDLVNGGEGAAVGRESQVQPRGIRPRLQSANFIARRVADR